jgi:hypothetical protein
VLGESTELALAEPGQGFIPVDGRLRRANAPNPNPGFTRRFTNRWPGPMTLFEYLHGLRRQVWGSMSSG